jgi:hypothetical protein
MNTPPKDLTLLTARILALLATSICIISPFFGFLLMFCAYAALDLGVSKHNF